MSDYQLNKQYFKQSVTLFFILFLSSFNATINAQNNQGTQSQIQTSFVYKELSSPNPSKEAKALYHYLQNVFGEKILSGQMNAQGGINEVEYIMNVTAKQPAIQGFNLEFENTNQEKIQKGIDWWKAGGIPLYGWDWAAPTFSEGFENSKKEIAIEKCFQEGTPEYKAFWKDLKSRADRLEKLRDAGVPVLWCPFPEANGNTFWWGKQGPVKFIKLWQTMYNYMVKERKLNNLIWIQSFAETINRDWFPGNSYVDIIGLSSYDDNSAPQQESFNKAEIIINKNFAPVAYEECAVIPDPDECKKTGAVWSWWMQRPAPYLTKMNQEYLSKVYYNDLIITLNKLPDFVKDYGGETVKRTFYSGTFIPFDELKAFSLGKKSGSFSINNGQLEIDSNGNGIKGKKDDGYFVFKQMEGDFDISVQVISLSPVNLYAMAGIMARASLSKKSPNVFFQVFPDNNQKNKMQRGCELKYRTENSNETQIIYPDPENAGNKYDVDFPNTWIRLKRRGNIFKSYISHDNSNWYIYSIHRQEMPEKLLVGLAAASSNKQVTTKAVFKDIQITWE